MYPVIFIDAIVVKVRDGQVTNKPFYVVIGVTTAGERDILGIWAGEGGEGAKFWLGVLTEIKNRGVEDVLIAVCDGLKGLPEAITTSWEYTQVQTCVTHLIRNTFRYAARQDWDRMAKDLRPIYTAVNAEQAAARLDETEPGRLLRDVRRVVGPGWPSGLFVHRIVVRLADSVAGKSAWLAKPVSPRG